MGYYTRFDMSVYDGNYNSFDIAKYMLEKNKENRCASTNCWLPIISAEKR